MSAMLTALETIESNFSNSLLIASVTRVAGVALTRATGRATGLAAGGARGAGGVGGATGVLKKVR